MKKPTLEEKVYAFQGNIMRQFKEVKEAIGILAKKIEVKNERLRRIGERFDLTDEGVCSSDKEFSGEGVKQEAALWKRMLYLDRFEE